MASKWLTSYLLCHFVLKMIIYQDTFGTDIGNTQKQMRFAQVDLWVAEYGSPDEGPGLGYNSSCSPDHNRTSGLGCAAGPKGCQADHGYEDSLFASRVQGILQSHPPEKPFFIFWAPHLVHTSLMVPGAYLAKFDFMQPTDKPGPVWSHDSDIATQPNEGHTRQLCACRCPLRLTSTLHYTVTDTLV
jgi:hypothetical protein